MQATISKKELYQLRHDLHNKNKLHMAARERIKKLEETVKAQKREITELKVAREQDHTLILELKRQLEELRAKIFKKRKKRDRDTEDGDDHSDEGTQKKGSLKRKHTVRPIPKAEEVTSETHHPLQTNNCIQCDYRLTTRQTVYYYLEDIILSNEQPLKTVEKTEIERGWCTHCKRWQYAKPPPPAALMLGPKVKAYICYLSILLRLSYEQIRAHLKISYILKVSDGEISHILEKEAVILRPEYEALNKRIDKQVGVHEDETGWPVQIAEKGKYGWVKTGTETQEAIFRFGESRGGGVAREITGQYSGVGITDDYSVYHSIFGKKHQLCWAHVHRKLRDLSRSKVFNKPTNLHCMKTYASFSVIYSKLRNTLALEWDADRNKRVHRQLLKQIRGFGQAHKDDPLAMTRVKARLLEVTDKYLTCLLYKGIPADNNKAERALRHMVIKRRTAFGSKTQKGAEVMSVLASVILSIYWTNPDSFWEKYMAVRNGGV